MAEQSLGRRIPTDWRHVERYPIRQMIDDQTAPTKVPVVIGVNWYTAFDRPVKLSNGQWWVGVDRDGKFLTDLGRVRGGHCVCLKPTGTVDLPVWWKLMDQGAEGSCVGFGSTRFSMLLNRERYDPLWLYHEAQMIDEWADTPPEEGTSVRAAFDVLRTKGHRRLRNIGNGITVEDDPDPNDGISANRWATTVDEVLDCLGSPWYRRVECVGFLNSWGRDYPHITYMPLAVLQRLLDEYGEATIATDR